MLPSRSACLIHRSSSGGMIGPGLPARVSISRTALISTSPSIRIRCEHRVAVVQLANLRARQATFGSKFIELRLGIWQTGASTATTDAATDAAAATASRARADFSN